jgi:hypothetical protein
MIPKKDPLPRTVDSCFDIGIAHGARLHEIDRATKESRARLFEAKIRFKRERIGMPTIEFDQKVDVAPFGVEIAARSRAKKIEPPHMKAAAQRPQFLAMQLDLVNHRARVLSCSCPGNDALGVPHPQLA